MDQLMSDFTPPRVSTSFERKVGASLCKASELAMSDKLPKFRLVSAETSLNLGNLSLMASSDALHRLAPTFLSKLVDTLGGVKSDMS